MKKSIILLIIIVLLSFPVFGKVNVVTSYPYIADIVHQVGGDNVSVVSLARGSRDPHYITPRPSFIAKLRKAGLLVINGGQLEIGWLPPVISQANNARIIPGGSGLLNLMDFVEPLEVPVNLSRANGDVHPEGNPHIQLDPVHIPLFARAICDRLCQLDKEHCAAYKSNFEAFNVKWQKKMQGWSDALAPLKGKKVVQYHKLFQYFLQRYGIESAGTLEPLPGIPPGTRHISGIIDLMKKDQITILVQDVYHSSKTAKFVAKRSGGNLIILPHDVGALKGIKDIFSLFDEMVRRLTAL